MITKSSDQLPTRASLLHRMQDPTNEASWQDFDRIYRKLIVGVAKRWGLTCAEAEDVAQETTLTVWKAIPGFSYDPSRCSFKSWLRRLTESRIIDHLRRRPPTAALPPRREDPADQQKAIEAIPDPNTLNPAMVWETEWQQEVVELALERLRRRARPLAYQMFYLRVIKGHRTCDVALQLGVTSATVHLAKFRLTGLFRKCVAEARLELDQGHTVVAGP